MGLIHMELRQLSRWFEVLYHAGSRRRLIALAFILILGLILVGLGFTAIISALGVVWTLSNPLAGLAVLLIGSGMTLFSMVRINERMITLISGSRDGQSLLNLVYERMISADKPRVVVFSNGIGLFILLNALKEQVSRVDVVLPQGEDTQIYGELLQANNLNLRNIFLSNIPRGTICAEFGDGTVVEGILSIKEARKSGIRRLFVRYEDGIETDPTMIVNSELLNPSIMLMP